VPPNEPDEHRSPVFVSNDDRKGISINHNYDKAMALGEPFMR